MYPSHSLRRIACCLIGGAGLVCSFSSAGPAKPPAETSSEPALYDAAPEHLWNRLHEAMFVRVGPDGRAYGWDRLEPLLWPGSKHLLEDRSHWRAVGLLEEFLERRGENLVQAPLERAVLQRDLWLVFNWLENAHGHFYRPGLDPEAVSAAQERLRRPLAEVIRRLALTPEEIEALPDNYAAAVASGAFPARFDPSHPDRPYLPGDLFAANGPWVCVGRLDGPVAPEHLRDDRTNAFTSSAFLLFLRLPAGRAATLEYLGALRSFDRPVMAEAKDGRDRPERYLPNPDLPALPSGTETALVRRALLIASTNRPVASAVTESVQLRVYREVPGLTVESLGAALDEGTEAHRRAGSWQSFHELRLSRSLLFSGRAGGLRAVGADERDFRTPFSSWYLDEFENREDDGPDRPFSERSQSSIKGGCLQCHSLPGVSSFNSYFNARVHLNDAAAGFRPFSLWEMPVPEVAGMAVRWKEGRQDWARLRKLLEQAAHTETQGAGASGGP